MRSTDLCAHAARLALGQCRRSARHLRDVASHRARDRDTAYAPRDRDSRLARDHPACDGTGADTPGLAAGYHDTASPASAAAASSTRASSLLDHELRDLRHRVSIPSPGCAIYGASVRSIITRRSSALGGHCGERAPAESAAPRARGRAALHGLRDFDVLDLLGQPAQATVNQRPDGTVIGDPVNVASRLQTSASPGPITVGQRTQPATGNVVECVALEPLEPKGKAEPVARPGGRSVCWRSTPAVLAQRDAADAAGCLPPAQPKGRPEAQLLLRCPQPGRPVGAP